MPSVKWGLERETGLEPATFSLEGLNLYAVWRPSWSGVHFLSSYRVVLSLRRQREADLRGSCQTPPTGHYDGESGGQSSWTNTLTDS